MYVSIPLIFIFVIGRDGLHFALKQSDMCLVCIAFASWVLRSTDPQAVDAWKAGKYNNPNNMQL